MNTSNLWLLLVLLLPVCPVSAGSEYGAPLQIAAINGDIDPGNGHLLNPSLNKGVLLIAGKNLHDPNFEKTIVLITEYTDEGTIGLVVNRPTEIPVAEALPRLSDYMPYLENLYVGGPVANTSVSLLLKSEDPLPGINQVITDIYHISVRDLFTVLLINKIDELHIRIYAGFAGWAPGQLESELIRGDWFIWHADTSLIFNPEPEQLWDELIRKVSAKWVSR